MSSEGRTFRSVREVFAIGTAIGILANHSIHFRFADSTALRQAAHVANWACGHFLRPIGD
jgi:hypothetical protein